MMKKERSVMLFKFLTLPQTLQSSLWIVTSKRIKLFIETELHSYIGLILHVAFSFGHVACKCREKTGTKHSYATVDGYRLQLTQNQHCTCGKLPVSSLAMNENTLHNVHGTDSVQLTCMPTCGCIELFNHSTYCLHNF